jgi:hypothetical protein
MLHGDSLSRRFSEYKNVASHNDAVYEEFERRANEIGFLKEHRDWVEANAWGFGLRSFHYMWLLIIDYIQRTWPGLNNLLEIGVYKGQVLSLWALCSAKLGAPTDLYAISPFSGSVPQSRALRRLKTLFSPRYRRLFKEANAYPDRDYLADCATIFNRFDLPFEAVHTIRGSSLDSTVHAQVAQTTFSVVYIDGDHRYAAVQSDIRRYATRLRSGGLLVMDDSACELPGTFPKGLIQVSRAAQIIPSLGFQNVLNVAHNRIYVRL